MESWHLQSGDAVIDYWRYIISFKDAHPPYEIPHLPQEIEQLVREMWVHLQNSGYCDTADIMTGNPTDDLNLL
jgi:hypothetical protein